ncbi:MAG: thrombospondin type 3 repeat-containing protein, partial [Myxococcota bacterium]|nr:thrombospondin type 3 repeat-containing protein [Myxococcota bacterium]
MKRSVLVPALITAAAMAAALPTVARAQVFPPEAAWVPLRCGAAPMNDRLADEPGAVDERDIVGDTDAPAGMRAVDAQFLYLRLRVDLDPAPGGTFRPAAWGMAIDLDGDRSTYEVLVLVDALGSAPSVGVFRNTVTTLPNDPNDPADAPVVASFPVSTHARSIPAAGSAFGLDPDHFLELAVPWSTLVPLGLDRDTPVAVWAASSTSATSLNGDFACHDGARGDPRLDEVGSDVTVFDPIVDSDGDGFSDADEVAGGSDPRDPASTPR